MTPDKRPLKREDFLSNPVCPTCGHSGHWGFGCLQAKTYFIDRVKLCGCRCMFGFSELYDDEVTYPRDSRHPSQVR